MRKPTVFHRVLQRRPGAVTVRGHLSRECLADLFCGDLSFVQAWAARRHLTACPECRLLQQRLEGAEAESMLRLYRCTRANSTPIPESMKLPQSPRAAFATWLQFQPRQASERSEPSPVLWRLSARFTIPAIATGMAVGLGIGVFAYWWQHVPVISANAFLVRAGTLDTPNAAAPARVAHQTVRIQTPEQTLERRVSWDLQRKRKLRLARLTSTDERLKAELGLAGVDWDEPISAADYQAWHDRQDLRTDHIARTGLHLLTLTTVIPTPPAGRAEMPRPRVPGADVIEESLTVRDSDFHPIRRTVNFRDRGMVEIAEVDFTVLAWVPADANAFEPLGADLRPVVSPAAVLPAPSARTLVSGMRGVGQLLDQLDEAELSARLVLNQLHADTGEQIAIRRLPQSIEVDGLVQSDERKHQLSAQLATIPYLKVSLQSIADFTRTRMVAAAPDPSSGTSPVRVETAALPDNPSALESYLHNRGLSIESTNLIAQQLSSCALRVSRESRAIAELQGRFDPAKKLPVLAEASLASLLYSHSERLQDAVREERLLLLQASGSAASLTAPVPSSGLPLAEAAARNFALSRELTQTSVPASRGAQAIFEQMTEALNELTVSVHQAYARPHSDADASERN